MVGKYKVITLCGSTRFKDAFMETQKRLTLEGNIVISVGLFGHSGDDEVWTEGIKEMLDDMHKRKIDIADEIYVINVGGYLGSSTRSEIEYAIATGKAVYYLEEAAKFANGERCHTPVVDTETIQRLFINAYNLMMQDRVQIIKQCEAWRDRLMDFGTLETDIERQIEETQVVAELVKTAVKENASTAQSQEAYLKKYEALTERYEKAAAELERLQSLRTARSQQDKKMALYIRTLKKQPEVMHDWNDTIWTVMVEKAIVHKDGSITFRFYSGAEIKAGA